MPHHPAWLLLPAYVALAPTLAHAAGELTPSTAQTDSALPELPRLAPITRPEPDVAALRELDRLLEQLTSADAHARESARASVNEAIPGVVDAIRLRVQDVRGSINREVAPRVLADARKEARKAQRGDEGKRGDESPAKAGNATKAVKRDDRAPKKDDGKDDSDGDWLDFMLATPHPKDGAWRDVVKLLAMERMLVAVGTTPAVRELISLHAYFGELLRIDMQRQITKLRDKAVPALIEARQHDAKIVQRWATKQLDLLGRAIPGEAVASNDTQILADVLRAYGRTRDVDAVRVILSFCNSDRERLREAAREAIASIGEPGIWQLRDVYLNLTGNKPPREWAWERLARELFATYDRARLAEVYQLMDDGIAQAKAGKTAAAAVAFDKVLARSPLFERRKEMIETYVAQARSLSSDQREEALAMMRKALRLAPTGPQAKKIEAEVAYLEGLVLIERGTPDKFELKHALELDPTHAGAQAALASLEDKAAERKSFTNRYIAAGVVGFAALLSMIFLARRRTEPPASPPQSPEPTPGDPDPASPPPDLSR